METARTIMLLFCITIILLVIYSPFIWIIVECIRKKHPSYKTDESGHRYCPAINDLRLIKKMRREIRITGGVLQPVGVQPSFSSNSVAEEITKLAELKAQGHLTDQEFNDRKKRLLN
jgi:hypothetical protein